MGRTIAAILLMCWLSAMAGAVAFGEDAKRDGPYIEKWPSDVHKIDAQYKDGDLEGPYLENFENGRIKIRANYSKGKRTGPYQEFFDNGKSHIV
ncbi:MAG TPA: hypothetical protein VL860_12135, partial [Planctomycetota bacterium]|nr:hypothetical protein [Planctomycetota bacterium]